MLPLTKKKLKSHPDATVCYICRKRLPKQFSKDKNYRKVRDYCYFTGKYRVSAHRICKLRFNMPNEILSVFHNRSNSDYHFIIKLANESEGQFECLGENAENYKIFSVLIEKEIAKVDKSEIENIITIAYKIKFIDSARFVASSLSNLVNNLGERIHKLKCEDCDCFLEYESAKGILTKYRCLSCNKNYSNKLDEEFKKRFRNTFKFCNNNFKKSILLLRKGVYPYEDMDQWEKFNETSLLEKDDFYNNLNMESITDSDYNYAKRISSDFETKYLGKYNDLCLKSNTLLLADVFENFRKMCQLDPARFLSAPGLA